MLQPDIETKPLRESYPKAKATRDLRDVINSVAKTGLTSAMADELVALFAAVADGTVKLAKRADAIRSQHLTDGKYDTAFKEWWKSNNLAKRGFGSMSKFTKLAMIGELQRKAEKDGFADKLPGCLTARYEASQLTDDERKKCFGSGVLHADAKAAAISKWRKGQRRKTPTTDDLAVAALKALERRLLSAAGTYKDALKDGICALIAGMRAKPEVGADQAEGG